MIKFLTDLRVIFAYLFAVIRWRYFEKRQYTGRTVWALGRHRAIFMESFNCFYVDGIKAPFVKADYHFSGVKYELKKK